MPSHDTIPRILPSDLPPEAIERLALAVNYRFSPNDDTTIRRAKSFLDALNRGRHGWGGNYQKGDLSALEHPNSAQKLDVVGDPVEAFAHKRRNTFEVFLLIFPGYAFSIELVVNGHNVHLRNLEAHPGEHYAQLVQHARRAYLTKRLAELYEEAMKGSAPVLYEDFLHALDELAKAHPQLSSGRDARILSEGQPDEPQNLVRSMITRGRA